MKVVCKLARVLTINTWDPTRKFEICKYDFKYFPFYDCLPKSEYNVKLSPSVIVCKGVWEEEITLHEFFVSELDGRW
jgi:hypothetical protein